MREILFRGKRIDNGEWVDSGTLIHFDQENECYIPAGHSKCQCAHDEADNIIKMNEAQIYKVLPETVGQYTGLTDKNGKKIYEGDIVKFVNHTDEIYSEEIGVCVFEQDECNFVLQRKVKNPENYHIPTSISTVYLISNRTHSKECWYEVIGNIHDNPELLKGAPT